MRATEAGYWRQDRSRYPKGSWINQPALWAIGVYRFGRWTYRAPRPLRIAAHALYFALYSAVRLATGIDIPRSVRVGPGLMIHHFGGVIVNPQAVIGARCTLRHGVTIGSKMDGGPVPVIGDNVVFGAYAQVLGDIHVGDNSTIGAMTVILRDVPAGAIAVGIPGRILGGRHL